MPGLELIGFDGISLPIGAALLDGSEADGTNTLAGGVGLTSGWTAGQATLATAVSTAPDGTTTAATITEDNASSRHFIYQLSTSITGQFTVSAYFKDISRRYVCLHATDGGGFGYVYVYADLQTGAITDSGAGGTGSVSSTAIAAAANGFYKVTLIGQCVAGASQIYAIPCLADRGTQAGGSLDSNCPSYAGDGAKKAYIWRPKLVD